MGKYEPKVSIVTVVYNDVSHIEGTILSVTRQNYPNLEYIVIDGGSTDGTVDVIKKYADKIAYWVSEPDKGIYDAMNKGIAVATGEWILFRNCGDYFSSLSDVSKVFNGERYEGVDILCGKCLRWDEYGYYISGPNLDTPNCVHRMFVHHSATFIRVSLHKTMPFDTRYRVAADYNFMLRSYKMGKVFKYVPYLLSIFDIREGASSLNWHNAIKENYYVNLETNVGKLAHVKLLLNIYRSKVKEFIRNWTPDFVMRKRRLSQGRKLWNDSFTYREMIKQAITQQDTDFTN